jgi:ABC-type transport system involved in multi-copper enzyme maturation permease subunit
VIGALSPAGAYFNTLPELVWADPPGQYGVFAQFGEQPDYLGLEPWFNLLSMGVWAVAAPLVGYLRFRAAELG